MVKYKTLLTNLLAVSILFLGSVSSASAQENDYKKNSFFVTYGNIILADQISFSLERTVYQKKELRTKLKLNYGNFLSNNYDLETDSKEYESYIGVSGVFIYNLFEIGIGVAYTEYKLARGQDSDPNKDYSIKLNSATIFANSGIRYETGNFLLRAGIGNFEYLYAGIGVNF